MCTQWSWMARHCLSKMVRAASAGYAGERWRSDTTPATVVTLSSCVSLCRHIRLGLLQHVSDVLPRARQGHAGDATSAGPWRQSVRANALACRRGWNVLILCGLAVGRCAGSSQAGPNWHLAPHWTASTRRWSRCSSTTTTGRSRQLARLATSILPPRSRLCETRTCQRKRAAFFGDCCLLGWHLRLIVCVGCCCLLLLCAAFGCAT